MTDSSEPQVSEDGEQEVSEAQIAVHWREEEYYYPPERSSGRPTPLTRRYMTGSAKSSSRTASRSTRTC